MTSCNAVNLNKEEQILNSDIIQRNRLQNLDTLTGLYNRSYFIELTSTYIKRCEENNERFAVLILDLDGFKEINDSLGYDIGDILLIQLSNRLIDSREDRHIISRLSGDEYAILCKLETKEDIDNYARKIIRKIKEPFTFGSTILRINAKIGISTFPENGLDAETLIRYADIATYKANDLIDDKICYYTKEMYREMKEKFLFANYLVEAISNDEISIFYQPIFDIESEKIMGLEALLRWESPILGMVSPSKFVPIAEKTGQIAPIGEWVLEKVCKQIDVWKCKGYFTIPVSVNLSVKQLEQNGFAQLVMKIMKKNNVKADSIELEITESVSSGSLATIIENLKKLKKHGIKISMDDFGTGFSSLGQLDLFELDKLKIDKIFIDDLINTRKRQNLVKSIIAMAKGLNLTVVAEGIETKEQLDYLKAVGCQLGQGYFFSKPLPLEEIEEFLVSRC